MSIPTWRNVNAANFSGVNQGMAFGAEQINRGLKEAQGLFSDYFDRQEVADKKARTEKLDAFKNALAPILFEQDAGGIADAGINSGQYVKLAEQMVDPRDRASALTFLQGLQKGARDTTTSNVAYANTILGRENTPVQSKFDAALAGDDFSTARDLIGSLQGDAAKAKATLSLKEAEKGFKERIRTERRNTIADTTAEQNAVTTKLAFDKALFDNDVNQKVQTLVGKLGTDLTPTKLPEIENQLKVSERDPAKLAAIMAGLQRVVGEASQRASTTAAANLENQRKLMQAALKGTLFEGDMLDSPSGRAALDEYLTTLNKSTKEGWFGFKPYNDDELENIRSTLAELNVGRNIPTALALQAIQSSEGGFRDAKRAEDIKKKLLARMASPDFINDQKKYAEYQRLLSQLNDSGQAALNRNTSNLDRLLSLRKPNE
ncbi:MAG: hypothetical protein E6R13_05150 [Spirochaetes bacterium]|nr:MAG: hypothetical protein E6R13_05150 [Spirochaetota bacterium]